MSTQESALLEACLAGDHALAASLAARHVGLRHFCPRRDTEPLVASARQGYLDVFDLIFSGSHFEPFDSAISEAMGAATAHGHLEIALKCWAFGADIDFASLDHALDYGHTSVVCSLMRSGAIDPRSPHPDLPSALDYLFLSCCSRGLEAPARECIDRGAALAGGQAQDCALALALHGMEGCAAAWMARSPRLSPAIALAWENSFPALMLAARERRELELSGLAPLDGPKNKPRL